MKKTLYSLMLNEDVVREIDVVAHRMGTNRSALINQILADYASVVTPERRIENIFRAIEELVTPARELVPFFAPNAATMTLKSSLAYKYRPTVKYEVSLENGENGEIGVLTVAFRTQSEDLLSALTYYFRLIKRIEDSYLAGRPTPPRHALYDGKFIRTLTLAPNRDYTSEEIAEGISDYVQLFDYLMKRCIGGYMTDDEIIRQYSVYLAKNKIIV